MKLARWVGVLAASLGLVFDSAAGPNLPPVAPVPAQIELPPGPELLPLTPIGLPSLPTLAPPAEKAPDPAPKLAPALPAPKLAPALPPAPEMPELNPPRVMPAPQPMPALQVVPAPVLIEAAPPFPFPFARGETAMSAEVDFLYWRYRGQPTPAAATTGSPLDALPGALGQPNTSVLIGSSDRDDEWTIGVRARLGGPVGESGFGWELGGIYTPPRDERTFLVSGTQVLARPFFDTVTGTESTLLVGLPGAFTGDVAFHTRTAFWTGEANATYIPDPTRNAKLFFGARYADLQDELQASGRYTVGPAGVASINGVALTPGAQGFVVDEFITRNQFFGGQVGCRFRASAGKFGCDVRAAVAVGVNHQRVEVTGRTLTDDGGGTPGVATAGLLAQQSNIGEFERSRVAALPEAGLKFTYEFMPGSTFHVGCDLLYWSSLVRAGDQVDTNVDTTQSPTSPNFTGGPGTRPVVPWRVSDFWAYGLNFGVRMEY